MKKFSWVFLIIIPVLFAFQSDTILDINLKQMLDEKQEIYMDAQYEKCLEELLLEAEMHVDSIIAGIMNNAGIEDKVAPLKPRKPNRPFDSIVLDSQDLSPILDGKSNDN